MSIFAYTKADLMIDDYRCPKYQKCPIFSGEGLKREQSKMTYRNLFCEAGKEKFESCKRYIASEETGKPVPVSVLPNSSLPMDEILALVNA